MNCPACGEPNSRILETRCFDGEDVSRRRACECGARWTTREVVLARTLKAGQAGGAQTPSASPALPHVVAKPPLGLVEDTTGNTSVVVGNVGNKKERVSPLTLPSSQRKNSEAKASGRSPAKGNQDPRVGEIFKLARDGWQAKYRASWYAEPGLAANVTAMLRSLDAGGGVELADIGGWIGRFYADNAAFLVQQRHALRFFCSGFNKYRVGAASNGMSERTQQTAEGLRGFLEMHNESGGR